VIVNGANDSPGSQYCRRPAALLRQRRAVSSTQSSL